MSGKCKHVSHWLNAITSREFISCIRYVHWQNTLEIYSILDYAHQRDPKISSRVHATLQQILAGNTYHEWSLLVINKISVSSDNDTTGPFNVVVRIMFQSCFMLNWYYLFTIQADYGIFTCGLSFFYKKLLIHLIANHGSDHYYLVSPMH